MTRTSPRKRRSRRGLSSGAIVTGTGTVIITAIVAGIVAAIVTGTGFVSATVSVVSVAGIVTDVPADAGRFGGLRGLFSGWVRRAIRCGAAPAGLGGVASGAGWRAMCMAARLMPPAAGRRWLTEAEDFLAEAPPALRRGAVGSYLTGAPQVIAVSWASVLTRRPRQAGSGPESE